MSKFTLVVSSVLFVAPAGAAQWVMNPTNRHLYRLNPAMLTWRQAEAEAIRMGGHLVTIRNQAEQAWIDSQFKPIYWIGMNDERVHNTWEWISGEPVTYTNWCTGPLGPGYDYLRTHQSTNVCWVAATATERFASVIEYAPKAGFSVFGKGCASTATTPIMASRSVPKVGQQFTLDISGFLPRAQFGQLVLGGSNTNWGFIKLPWELSIIGMQGCNLLVSHDVTGPIVTDAQGAVSVTVKVPLDQSLYGTKVYGQAWAPDARANPLGLAMTNAFDATIGL